MSLFRTFLQSKVARRISILFILCALLPISALAVISFTHVTGQLYEQSQKRLRHASKTAGMAIYERLTLLESEMKMMAVQTNTFHGDEAVRRGEQSGDPLQERFHGLAIERKGVVTVIYGREPKLPTVNSEQRRHLESGKTLLTLHADGNGVMRVFLSRPLVSGDSADGLLLAEVNAAYLWLGGEGVGLPAMTEMCVLTADAVPAFCSIEDHQGLARHMAASLGGAEATYFEWQDGSDEYLASFWTIPLKFQFSPIPLVVIMSERRRDALAPLDSFKYTFLSILALALCVVTLFSYRQIHSSLGPLGQLQQGTKRIADRDFTARVSILSSDEFGDLARSFNGMAERLERQFQMLDTVGAITRAILSSFEPRKIVEVLESRISDALSCDAIAISCFETAEASAGTLSVRFLDGIGKRSGCGISLQEAEVNVLTDNPQFWLAEGAAIPAYLSAMRDGGIDRVVLFPVFIQGRCAGFVALGYRGSHQPADDDLLHARQLADQVSVALSNAREIARRIEADAQAQFLANYDPLTRLVNRDGFHREVEKALAVGMADDPSGAVVLINLDRFQRVNDAFGPRAGDRVLEEVASRMSQTGRHEGLPTESMTAARMGSDQFGLLLRQVKTVEETVRVVRAMLAAISRPYPVSEQQVFLTASAGVAWLHSDGHDADLLLRNADTAMRAAKEAGRNGCRFYAESMNRRLSARLMLEAEVRQALTRGEFCLFYQPQVEAATGALVGVEALIRWQHPTRGLVSPADFVPVVEEDEELIVAVGEWVMREACRQQREWRRLAVGPVGIAMNVSALHFRRSDFVERFEAIVTETEADRRSLELELTETVLMHEAQAAVATLKRLRAMGVKLAMDDFGTGYSSLAYLRQFPVDKIKIDRAFVNEIHSSSDAKALTSAIIAMGLALNLHVLAEGVETEAQLAFLRERGCQTYQGFFYSRPLSAVETTRLLMQQGNDSLRRSA